MEVIWKPDVTVAAVIERDGRFLLIEEETDAGLRLNQPAGHWEPHESLIAATRRETLEESAYHFTPQALVGVYRYRYAPKNMTFLRFAFCGETAGHEPDRVLDDGIVRAVWLTPDEVRTGAAHHRTPLVVRCMEDYLAGRRYPLELLTHFD